MVRGFPLLLDLGLDERLHVIMEDSFLPSIYEPNNRADETIPK